MRAPLAVGWSPSPASIKTSLSQLLIEFSHFVEQVWLRKNSRFRVLVRLHDYHESHFFSPFNSI
jgi:hypothetical protein